MPPEAVVVDDWFTLRRAAKPEAIRTCLAETLRDAGVLRDPDLFHDAFDYAAAFHRTMTERDLREHTVEQVLSLAMYTLGFPVPPTHPLLKEAAESALNRVAEQIRWYDDAVPFLRSAKSKKLPLALVSNTIFGLGSKWESRLAEWFPARILSRDLGFVKPHPGMFLEAAKKVETPPESCLYVGDLLLSDVWGAQRVGMKAVLLDRSDEGQETFRADDTRLAANLGVNLATVKPAAKVTSLADVVPLLK